MRYIKSILCEEADMENEINFERLIDEELGFEDSDIIYDETQEEATDEQPFDADKIRIEQQMLSVKYLFELYESGLLETNPNFQRKPVWKQNKRKSLLIESLMLRIPIPAFYFYENEDSLFQVIDGQQRLITIFEFLQGKFKLSGLEYIGEACNKKSFNDLDERYKQRIYRTQLAVNVLDARSPHKVIYDIFRRINTGGIILTAQEMRNAICQQSARDYLMRGIQCETYLEATRRKINDMRMDSQEMFLRFVAFYRRYNFEKSKLQPFYYSKLVNLLDEEILEISKLSEDERNRIYSAFEKSMNNCKRLLGKYAFVKIYCDDVGKVQFKRDLINKSLFTSFAVIMANQKYYSLDLEKYGNSVLIALAKKLQEKEYEMAISGATGDRRNIINNFLYTQEVIDTCLLQS